MATVKVEITQELIDKHGGQLRNPFECPGFYALRAAGVPVEAVWFDHVVVNDYDYAVLVPEEFGLWQRQRRSLDEVRPITFTIEIEESVLSGRDE